MVHSPVPCPRNDMARNSDETYTTHVVYSLHRDVNGRSNHSDIGLGPPPIKLESGTTAIPSVSGRNWCTYALVQLQPHYLKTLNSYSSS